MLQGLNGAIQKQEEKVDQVLAMFKQFEKRLNMNVDDIHSEIIDDTPLSPKPVDDTEDVVDDVDRAKEAILLSQIAKLLERTTSKKVDEPPVPPSGEMFKMQQVCYSQL